MKLMKRFAFACTKRRAKRLTILKTKVACYFAAYYMKRKLNEPTWRPTLPSYKRALEIIKPRLDEDIYCIRRLRKNHLSFRDISKEEIKQRISEINLRGRRFSHVKSLTETQ